MALNEQRSQADYSDIPSRIAAYFGRRSDDPNHRYRSWEHCHQFFHARPRSVIIDDLDLAALQLGFYLASWGMYRGSSFLLQRDYKIHKGALLAILDDRFASLWGHEIGADPADEGSAPLILDAFSAVRSAYAPAEPSEILVTKILLGTVACLPACDRFFIDGFKRSGQQYSYVNSRFVARIIEFCAANIDVLRDEQSKIVSTGGMHYPLMKLADMYFWQIGFEAAGEPAPSEE